MRNVTSFISKIFYFVFFNQTEVIRLVLKAGGHINEVLHWLLKTFIFTNYVSALFQLVKIKWEKLLHVINGLLKAAKG